MSKACFNPNVWKGLDDKGAEENSFLPFFLFFFFFLIIIGEAIMANRCSTFTSKASFLIVWYYTKARLFSHGKEWVLIDILYISLLFVTKDKGVASSFPFKQFWIRFRYSMQDEYIMHPNRENISSKFFRINCGYWIK